MLLEKTNFSSSHIPDNDAIYFSLVEGVVNSIDEYSVMTVTNSPSSYIFRISPSSPKKINSIIQMIGEMSKFYGIVLNFSKSVKSSSSISFSICKFENKS